MANPPKFTPAYSYSGWQASNPAKPLPAPRIDNDFASIQASLNAAIDGLADVRRSDGVLANQSVGPDQLSAALSIGFTFRGAWDDGGSYSAGDGVVHDGVFYSARVTHTASGDNDPPNAAVWNELFSVADIAVAGALTMPRDGFTGDGSTKTFALTFVPLSSRNLFVTIGGVLQSISEYTVNGSDIIFAEAPPAGYEIEVRAFATTATTTVPEDGTVTSAKLADASVTEQKLADASVTEQKLADSGVTVAKLASDVLARAPAVVANTILVGNADGTANVPASFPEVTTLLGLEPKTTIYETRSLAVAATIAAPVLSINVLGCISAGDFGGAVYIRAASEPSHLGKFQSADGAWWELVAAPVHLQHFAHLVVDYGLATEDWLPAYNAARDYALAKLTRIKSLGRTFSFYGQVNTRSYLTIEWEDGAWWFPKAWSDTGSFITNVVLSPEADRPQTNITLINPQLDGQYLPYDLAANDNAMGWAHGAGYVRIIGGHVKNFAFSWSGGGAGGKGNNFEGGAYNSSCVGLVVENCGIGVFAQGYAGSYTTGALKAVTGILYKDILAINCECAAAALGIDTSNEPDGSPAVMEAVFDGITAKNCGNAPNRPVTANFEKSGVFCIGEGQNVTMRRLRVYNDAAYSSPTWPAGGSEVVGAGLTGVLGAVLWVNGRNITIEDVEATGNWETVVRFNRCRAIGEDAAASAKPLNNFNINIDGVKVYQTVTSGVALASVIALDSNAGARIINSEISATVKNVVVDTPTAIVDTTLNGYSDITIDVTDRTSGKRVIGTGDQINDHFADFAECAFASANLLAKGFTIQLLDDEVTTFSAPSIDGFLEMRIATPSGSASGVSGTFVYNFTGSAFLEGVPLPSNVEVGTTALTTDLGSGTDGKLCLAAVIAGRTFYVKNRRAATLNLYFNFR